MELPVSQKIMDLVSTRLKGIRKDNGYHTNLGSNVLEWDPTNQADDKDLLEFRDASYGASDNTGLVEDTIGFQIHAINLEIDIITAAGGATLPTVRKMIADVLKAVGTDIKWSTLAEITAYEGADIDFRHEGKKIGGVSIRFSIIYKTALWEI